MDEKVDDTRDSIEIHGLSSGGDGVGRGRDGRTLFVPLTAPGDRVGVRIVKRRKRYGHAVLEAIEEAAPGRVTPACGLFGECGGCDWQHLSYTQQCHWKGQIVEQTLQRVGKLGLDEQPLSTMQDQLPVHAAAQPYEMRSRARLPLSPDRRPGFFRGGSREVVEVAQCPVLTPVLNVLLGALHEAMPRCPLPVEQVRLLGDDGIVALSLHLAERTGPKRSTLPKPKTNGTIEEWCQLLADAVVAAGASLSGVSWWRRRERIGVWQEPWITHGAPAIVYRPEGFAQASFAANQTLVARVLGLLGCASDGGGEGQSFIEVYAGRGNLTLPIVQTGARVLALDSDVQALADGREAASHAGLQQRVSFQRFHDESGSLAELCREHGHAEPKRIILDPPRQGLSASLCEQLLAMQPQEVLYVSCDPATLARDLRKWVDAGYRLHALEIVDLIPQTAHVESLALLRRTPA